VAALIGPLGRPVNELARRNAEDARLMPDAVIIEQPKNAVHSLSSIFGIRIA